METKSILKKLSDENFMQDLSVVIPVFNENHEIVEKIVQELESLTVEVIVVDDGSSDPYPKSIKHGTNFGYGASLLTGIKNATRSLIITCDGDGQHSIGDIINLYIVWRMLKTADMIIGSRRLKTEKWHRTIGRKTLNLIASIVTGYYFHDLNSGLRMFKRDVAVGYAPILCKNFSFTTSITISMLCDGYRVESFPINVDERKYGESKVKVIKHGFLTLYYILYLGTVLRTRRLRAWVRSLPWIGKATSMPLSQKNIGPISN